MLYIFFYISDRKSKLEDIMIPHNTKFNVLVTWCEGCHLDFSACLLLFASSPFLLKSVIFREGS